MPRAGPPTSAPVEMALEARSFLEELEEPTQKQMHPLLLGLPSPLRVCERGGEKRGPHLLTGHEFEQALGDGEGMPSLACFRPRGRKELDTTERLNNHS